MVRFQNFFQRLATVLCRKRHETGIAAERRRHTAGVVIIRRHEAAGRLLLDVAMRLYTAGQYIFAAGVDHAFSSSDFLADGNDLAIADTDVGRKSLR